MLLFAACIVLIGLFKRQGKRYWLNGLAALALQAVVSALFNGGGTLEDSTGDGILTAMVRAATNDGPIMGVFALFVIILGWAVPIWIVRRGYQSKEKVHEKNDSP